MAVREYQVAALIRSHRLSQQFAKLAPSRRQRALKWSGRIRRNLGNRHHRRNRLHLFAALGVLFLDELPEFRRAAIESLRPIMESDLSVIVRASERMSMPARPLVVAAMNPCPCGYAGDKTRVCHCSPDQVRRYRARVSGPMLDRFDLHVLLPPVRVSALNNATVGESSAAVAERVALARLRQQARLEGLRTHAALSERRILEQLGSTIQKEALQLLQLSVERLGLSLRAYVKALKVSRTIADLEGQEQISAAHVAEAVQYRLLDRDSSSEATRGRRRPPSASGGFTRYA